MLNEGFVCLLTLLLTIEANQQFGQHFSVHKNAKCSTNVLEQLIANTILECAVQCTKRQGCTKVNYKSPQCEIVPPGQGDNETMVEEIEWRCIRKYNENAVLSYNKFKRNNTLIIRISPNMTHLFSKAKVCLNQCMIYKQNE